MVSSTRPKLTTTILTLPKFPELTGTLTPTAILHSAADSSKFPSPPPDPGQSPTLSTFPSTLTSSTEHTSKTTSTSLPSSPTSSSLPSSSDPILLISAPASIWLPCLQCTLHGLRCSFTASWQLRFVPNRKTPPSPIPPEHAQCARCYRIGDIVCLRQKLVNEDEGEKEDCIDDKKKRVGFELIEAKWEGKAEELIREKLWKDRWALPLGVGDKRRVRVVEMVKYRWGKVVDETGEEDGVEVQVSDAEEVSQGGVSQTVP